MFYNYVQKNSSIHKRFHFMRMIIDTDAGVDDAQAIMLALAHPDCKVEAITTVTGNVHIDSVVPNVLTVLQAMNREVPVYRGITLPLVTTWDDASEFHGSDGLGNYHDRPPITLEIEDEHAVHALIRMVNESPHEYTLVALAPLTNIAMAIRLDPTFPSKVREFIFMGGTLGGWGNTPNIAAEYNIYGDPEAAYIVLEAFPRAKMLSWETTFWCAPTQEQFIELVNIHTHRSRFFRRISLESAERNFQGIYQGWLIPDPLAMAITLKPELILESKQHYVTVELGGCSTRGQTVVDYTNFHKKPANIEIITEINKDGVIEMFKAMLEDG